MLGQQDTQQWTGKILCRRQLCHLFKIYFNYFILWFLLLLLASGNLVVFTIKTVKGKWILPPKTSPPTASLAGQISFLSSFVSVLDVCLWPEKGVSIGNSIEHASHCLIKIGVLVTLSFCFFSKLVLDLG